VNLDDWRRRIDEIDRKLVTLLNERSQCAIEVGHLKRTDHLPLYQPDREVRCLRTPSGRILGRCRTRPSGACLSAS
jgi:chorismate mutase/prephenate dehydratase